MADTLIRRRDWPSRLEGAVARARRTRFSWGRHDCLLFVADCVFAMTGVDPAKAEFRGRYRTARGAARKMKAFCGGGLVETVETFAAQFGLEAIPPAFAQRGDVMIVQVEHGACAGVVDLTGRYCAVADFEGLRFPPLILATRAWRLV